MPSGTGIAIAAVMFIFMVALIGVLVWLSTRKGDDEQTPPSPDPRPTPSRTDQNGKDGGDEEGGGGGGNGNGNPPDDCTVTVIDSCRRGWRSKGGSRQWGVGGLQWVTTPDACANRFSVMIEHKDKVTPYVADFSGDKAPKMNSDPNSDYNGRPIYSFAIQGRDKPMSANAFRDKETTTWRIAPLIDGKDGKSTTYELTKDSQDRCGKEKGIGGVGYQCYGDHCD